MENEKYKLKDFFKDIDIKTEKLQFIKRSEIFLIFLISAFEESYETIRDGLIDQWDKITGKKPTEKEIEFIKEYPFKECYFDMLNQLKINSINRFRNKMTILDDAWFFMYLAKYYQTLRPSRLEELIEKIKDKEIAFGLYKESSGTYRLTKDLKEFIVSKKNKEGETEEWFRDLGAKVEKKYFADLEYIFDDVIEAIAKKNEKLSIALKKMFCFEDYEKYIGLLNSSLVSTDQEEAVVEPEPAPKTKKEVVIEAPQSDETVKLVLHKETAEKVNVSIQFEEAVNKVYDMFQDVASNYKQEGIEDLIKVLNSSSYGNLLDRVYFACSTKNTDQKEFLSIAILLKNALDEFGFAFDTYPKEPIGTCIGAPSDDQMEYIARNYRWKDEKILYKNLVIAAPGIINRKTKQFVYPPLVEVK